MTKANHELQLLPIDLLKRGKYQPRRQFLQEQLNELAQSISQNGIIQPLVVRKLFDTSYEIIAGERRWRAAQIAGVEQVPCLIRILSDEQAATIATIENLQRENLNPIEEAESFERLSNEFGYTHDEIAAIVGKDRSKITHSLRLLGLEQKVKNFILEGLLSEGHGKVLAGLPSDHQIQMAILAVRQKLSVRQLERSIKNSHKPTKSQNIRKSPDLLKFERALTEYLGNTVSIIDKGEGKGEVIISYQSLEIFEGICQKIGFNSEKI